MASIEPRPFLISLFEAAVLAADPYAAIRAHLPARPKGRTIVVGAGKAASQMAAAFERLWEGPLDGAVVARHGPIEKCERIKVFQSAHPVPDEAGLAASSALLEMVEGLTSDDLVVALISGGGSALLPAPPGGLTLEDEIAVNRALLASGAPISAMNVVRKHVSRVKGGRLALAAAPARVVSLVVSDVPGDNPAFVASGPTVPDRSSLEEAREIVARYAMALPERVAAHLSADAARAPSPDDPVFARNEVHVIASARVSLEAAAARARESGIEAAILSDAIEGEARDIGRMHAALAREVALHNHPFGRNSEFLLSLALDIDGADGIDALAADTDGIDGSEDNAGAFADGASIARMRGAGVDPRLHLTRHDAWTAFKASGDLFVPGPTGTNVNDLRAVLIR
ncbi:glycerate kinase [Sinorhizobium medicae]|nr:glycerate kinase [Sinorhizobium medicae]